MADISKPTTANGVSPPEAGLPSPASGINQPNAKLQPVPGVIFLLGLKGHLAAGYSQKEASDLYNLSLKYSNIVKNRMRASTSFEIIEFNSLPDLVSKVPRNKQVHWKDIIIVTHGPGEQNPQMVGAIFFGDQEYFISASNSINDILTFEDENLPLVQKFRKNFALDASMLIINCGLGAHGPEVPIYMRHLFGVEGLVATPKVDVKFTKTGEIGTFIDSPEDRADIPPGRQVNLPLRPIKKNEFLVIQPVVLSDLPRTTVDQLTQ